MKNSAILLISCPDQKGINAAIADFIYRANGNILHADEHQDTERNLFLMRVEWDLADFAIDMREFASQFQAIAARFGMAWRVALAAARPKVAIFVSQYDHCLADLLYRHSTGELACEIPVVISNHTDVARWAEFYKIPLHVIAVTKETKLEVEHRQLILDPDRTAASIAQFLEMPAAAAGRLRSFINDHQPERTDPNFGATYDLNDLGLDD